MKTSFFAVLAATLMTGSLAYANCSDNEHHDCGSFKIMSTVCNAPLDNNVVEHTLTEYAVFGNGNSVKLEKDVKKSGEDLDVLHGVIDEETDVYIEMTPVPDIIFGGTTIAYSAYTTSWGVKSVSKGCSIIIPEGAVMDLGGAAEGKK